MRRKDLTPQILKLMKPEDEARYASVVQPSSDVSEARIQGDFAAICKEKGWRPVWHGMHKRSTANRGCPDFIVGARGHSFWIEFKRPGETLSPDQAVFRMDLARNGIEMAICFSWQEAVNVIEQWTPSDGL